MSNTFNLRRFGALVLQSMIHDRKMYLYTLVGFMGGLFIVLFFLHFIQGSVQLRPLAIGQIYLFVFIVTGMLYAGAAFGGFRSKEKTINYLMIPASLQEKFLWECLSRMVAFMLLLPLLFWIVYNLESRVTSVLFPFNDYVYQPLFLFPEPFLAPNGIIPFSLMALLSVLVLAVPFAGASIFGRYPLIKTFFGVSLFFLFNTFLIYLFVEVLHFKYYNISPSGPRLYLVSTTADAAIRLFTWASLLANGLLIATAYYKLKEKEV